MRYYHGSPTKGLKSLRKGSYISKDKATAELMGRYHLDTMKQWSDEDLAEPHYFGTEPKWKKEPKGIGQLYQLLAKKKEVALLGNPYEQTLKAAKRVKEASDEFWTKIRKRVGSEFTEVKGLPYERTKGQIVSLSNFFNND